MQGCNLGYKSITETASGYFFNYLYCNNYLAKGVSSNLNNSTYSKHHPQWGTNI